MASPWLSQPPNRRPAERPWMGLALLLAVPFLSLILIRILWSGSTVWFLMAGVGFLAAAAFAFLARRNEPSYGYPTLTPELSRLPLVLLGLGALFLALLILPHASGSELPALRVELANSTPQLARSEQPAPLPTSARQQAQRAQTALPSATQTARALPSAQSQPAAQEESQSTPSAPPAGSQTYEVQDGDTLWDIAQRFQTTVDDIVAANDLANADDLHLGQELVIPPPSAGSNTAAEPGAPDQ